MRTLTKKSVGIFIILSIIISIFPIVYGYSYSLSDLTLTNTGSEVNAEVSIENTGKSSASGIAIVNFYDAAGKLADKTTQNVTLNAGEVQKITVSSENADIIKTAKAFVWDSLDGMVPKSETILSSEKQTAEKADYYSNTYTDIEYSDSVVQAAAVMSALGIMGGYSDGTFRPENTLSRGEAAEMAIKVLKKQNVADILKTSSGYDDIEAGTDMCGIANYCVQMNILSAENNKFLPDKAITYDEFLKMIISLLGYDQMAQMQGGWPVGYLNYADELGILEGVSFSLNKNITRADAVQMLYNSSSAPITKITGYAMSESGQYLPIIEIQHGTSWMNESHNVYYAEGYVSATSKIDSKYAANEVGFTIEYTENYEDMIISKTDMSTSHVTINTGNTNAADYLYIYSSILVEIKDDIATLISFIPSEKNNIQKFDTELIDKEYYYDTNSLFDHTPYLNVYPTKDASKSTKYNFDSGWQLYVNGVEISANKNNFEYYVLNNNTGTVTLIDRYSKLSKADGYYDIIMVDFYANVRIGAINSSTGKISFDVAYNNGGSNSIILDDENNDLTYDITLNGEKITVADLQEDDIISIAFFAEDYGTSAFDYALENSSFYEIIVSRDTAEGMYTRINQEDEIITIGGKEYKFAGGFSESYGLTIGNEYILYLDYFGRIFDYEEKVNVNYAILDRYTKSSADDYYRATLYTTDGTVQSLEVDTSKVTSISIDGTTYTGENNINKALQNLVYENGSSGAKNNNVQDRVVEYKVSSPSGRITSLNIVHIERAMNFDGITYKASTASLGNIKFDDSTKIVDAASYTEDLAIGNIPSPSELSIVSIDDFVDGAEYKAYAYGEKNKNGAYPYVVVTYASQELTNHEGIETDSGYAILDRYTKSSADDYYRATLYTAEGSAKTLEVDTSKVTSLTINGTNYTPATINSALQQLVYENGSSGAKNNNVQDRVVYYRVSSSTGRITHLEIIPVEAAVDAGNTYYNANTSYLGNIKFDSNTKMINAIDYKDKTMSGEIPSFADLSVTSVSEMSDGNEYMAYAYGTKNSDGAYPMVLVTYGGGNYTCETKLAVLNGVPGSGVEDGDDIYTMKLMYDGEKDKEFVVNDDYTAIKSNGTAMVGDAILDMAKGDVIVFRLDADGHIKEFDVIASASDLGLDSNYSAFLNKSVAATTKYTFGTKFSNWTGVWTQNEDPANSVQYSKEVTRVVFGPVIDNKTTFFTLGSIGTATNATVNPYSGAAITYSGLFTDAQQENGKGGVIDIDIANDTNVYVYDFSKNSSNRLAVGGAADLMALNTADANLANDGDYVAWNGFKYTPANSETQTTVNADDVKNGATFALVRMVDGEAKDVLVVTGK